MPRVKFLPPPMAPEEQQDDSVWGMIKKVAGDPTSAMASPMGMVGPVVGMTRGQVGSEILKLLRGNLPQHVQDDIMEALNVIRKGMPKKAMEHMKRVVVEPKDSPVNYSIYDIPSAEFGKHKNMGGRHMWTRDQISLIPLDSDRVPHGLAETFPHEIGHEVTSRLVERIARRMGKTETEVHKAFYDRWPAEMEGWADAIADTMRKKAGYTEPWYRPKSKYGETGEASERIIRDLERWGHNPYMDLRRSLENMYYNLYHVKSTLAKGPHRWGQ